MLHHTAGDPAAKVHLSLVDQAAEPDRGSFLMPCKGTLLRSDPGDLVLRDHASDDRLEEDLSESHESRVTKSLHPVACAWRAWVRDESARRIRPRSCGAPWPLVLSVSEHRSMALRADDQARLLSKRAALCSTQPRLQLGHPTHQNHTAAMIPMS